MRAQQQEQRFDPDVLQVEQLAAARAARGVAAEDGVAGEQACEQQAVAHQVDPEPEDGVAAGIVVMLVIRCVGVRVRAEGLRLLVNDGRHALTPGWPNAYGVRFRCARPRGSARSKSTSSSNERTMNVTIMPTKLATPIHQMCQTRREAQRQAQQAHDEADAGVARHVDVGVALAAVHVAALLHDGQRARACARPACARSCRTAAARRSAHSSVRPSHGSPVGSRSSSRFQMLTRSAAPSRRCRRR